MSKTWGLKNSLYKHKEQACFYYIVERTRCAQEKYQYICDLLTEYGGYVSSKKETAAYIMEHCEILIENNAVNIMKNIVCKAGNEEKHVRITKYRICC